MKLNKQQILNLHPCRDGLAFAKSCDFDIVKIWRTCERGDWLIWLLRSTGNLPQPLAVELAIACAEHVLARFELKYPNDKRPRAAIEAAAKWLGEPTEENRTAAYAAAYAADAAAYAADAAYAAAYAADDAAAAAAAAAARQVERKWQADKIREIVKCPFTN